MHITNLSSPRISRRAFVQSSALAGAGLALGLSLDDASAQNTAPASLGAMVKITPDNWVTVVVGQSEMGQGISTGVPMVVAEELGADWARVRWEQAPNDARNFGRAGGQQGTGGSSSQRLLMPLFQRGGAAARDMLLAAAAKKWSVDKASLRTEASFVIGAAGQRASFGELAAAAATEPVPTEVQLKDRKDWKIIGTSPPRLDVPAKTNGTAKYALDVQLPGMLTASVVRAPVFGAQLESFDAADALKVKGVRQVLEIATGVAVVADHYWAARKGREALKVKWRASPDDSASSDSIRQRFAAQLDQPGLVAESRGDYAGNIGKAMTRLEAVYESPYLAHQTMEPMNATAWAHDGMVEVWAGTQSPTATETAAVAVSKLPRDKVKVHTMLLGCGLGRRSEAREFEEAVELAMAVGKPIKVVMSREEDMRHDFYRPQTVNRMTAGLDAQGNIVAWNAKLAGQSIFSRRVPQAVANNRGIDSQSVECAVKMPYESIPHLLVEQHMTQGHVPVGFWRSVGASQNVFVVESFIDELAHAARQDPLAFRLKMMDRHPRHKRVLELAAEKSGWGTPLPQDVARGIAVSEAFEGFAAEVVEASVAKDGSVTIHRVVAACDFGTMVHPEVVRAQVVSSIVTGIDNALFNNVRIENGAVANSNFHDNPLPRMTDVPARIEVHLVDSTAKPGGVGEPAVPPLAPALAQAIFALTGQRLRSLPLRVKPLAA